MSVFTVMAENAEGDIPRLYNEAVRTAAAALATVDRFRSKGYQNILVYRETQVIDETGLPSWAAAEKKPGTK